MHAQAALGTPLDSTATSVAHPNDGMPSVMALTDGYDATEEFGGVRPPDLASQERVPASGEGMIRQLLGVGIRTSESRSPTTIESVAKA